LNSINVFFASSTLKTTEIGEAFTLSARSRTKRGKNEETLGEEVDQGGEADCVGLAARVSSVLELKIEWHGYR
jgi:hypothetical protein